MQAASRGRPRQQAANMSSPCAHALVLPYPVQGHVIPFMELSHCLVDRGFKVTFVNTRFNHERVEAAAARSSGSSDEMGGGTIRMVSIPDGLGPDEDRRDFGRLTVGLQGAVLGCLEELIRETNESGSDRISCVIADENMAWTLPAVKKMGLQVGALWPASAALLATKLSIPRLIKDGIIGTDGLPRIQQMFQLSPSMPPMNAADFGWNLFNDSKTRQIVFEYFQSNNRAVEFLDFVICNTFHELESSTFTNYPKIWPVGPLLGGRRSCRFVGNFWPEDTACMSWLDEQRANSVIYVAFGSLTVFEQRQFQEIALGLELSGRPFLWVVRPDLTDDATDAFPDGFQDRIAQRGKLIGWAPQQAVLAHPSVACFVSHCGWNSTLEGVSNGVPFLCWPYFADQFLNESYICDVWRVGLRMTRDESGIVSREEIKSKVEDVLGDCEMKSRALELKHMANRSISEGGSSSKNFDKFVAAMKKINDLK